MELVLLIFGPKYTFGCLDNHYESQTVAKAQTCKIILRLHFSVRGKISITVEHVAYPASGPLPLPHSPLFFACPVTQWLINSPFALPSHSDLESK